jgi:hypothetical protein
VRFRYSAFAWEIEEITRSIDVIKEGANDPDEL